MKSGFKSLVEYIRATTWLAVSVLLVQFWSLQSFRSFAETGGNAAVASVNPLPEASKNLQLGRKFLEEKKLRQAGPYLAEAVKMYERLPSSLAKFEAFILYGDLFSQQGEYNQALNYHFKAQTIAADLKIPKRMGDAFLAVGQDLVQLKDHTQASLYLTKAARIYIKEKNNAEAGHAYLNLGDCHQARNEFEKSEETYRLSLALYETAKNQAGRVFATERLARALTQQHKYAEAINELQKTLAMADSAGMPEEKAASFLDLGDCYYGIGKEDKAVFYGKIGLALSQRYKAVGLQERAHYLLSNTYTAIDQHARALRHYKSFVVLRDRIASDVRSKQLTEMRLRYENEKIGKEIAVLTRERRIQELDLARKQNLIWTGLGVIALLGLIALILQRKNQIERSTNTKLHVINTKIEQQRDQIEVQKAGLKDALGQLESSIQYAKRIQDAILSASAPLERHFEDPLIYFRPKAIVSGDFYWVSHQGDETILVVADCTGHGVPGAFLSLVGHSTLVRALSKSPDLDPSHILTFIDEEINRILGNQPGLDLKEGIEMSICVIHRVSGSVRFAGARRDALLAHADSVQTAPGSRRSVGGVYARQAPDHWRYETHYYPITQPCTLYLLSDGFTDQHGANGRSKFGLPRLRKLLQEIAHLPAAEQTKRLDEAQNQWRLETEQTDDILLVGLRLGHSAHTNFQG